MPSIRKSSLEPLFLDEGACQINFAYSPQCDKGESKIVFWIDDAANYIHPETVSQELVGFFSGIFTFKGITYIYRDPLGLAKLYFGHAKNGQLLISRSWVCLVRHNVLPADISSLPSGTLFALKPGGLKLVKRFTIPVTKSSLPQIPELLDERLESFFTCFKRWINRGNIDAKFHLALSGGLDSSTILVHARQHISVNAHTLSLPGSNDAKLSKSIASSLEVDHIIHEVKEPDILAALRDAPVLCEDWRDFNVHCSALNILLARKITKSTGKLDVIFTGDLMNEYLCDYSEEVINSVSYYRLPRLSPTSLQKWLVKGLSTSSREDRVFGNEGIIAIQPYAVTYDLYNNLSDSELELSGIKLLCNLSSRTNFLSPMISKTKLRAQVGSKESMGILGIAVKNNIDNSHFLSLLSDDLSQSEADISQLIFGGNFRTTLSA